MKYFFLLGTNSLPFTLCHTQSTENVNTKSFDSSYFCFRKPKKNDEEESAN